MRLRKRLMRLAETHTIYHGTNLQQLKDIATTGITPGNLISSFVGYTSPYSTFYTTDKSKARYYANIRFINNGEQEDDRPIIIELIVDDSYFSPDLDDCPDCQTWQESMEKVNQLSIKGSVPASQINKIYLLDSNREEIPFDLSDFLNNPNYFFELSKKIYKEEDFIEKVEEEKFQEKKLIQSMNDLQRYCNKIAGFPYFTKKHDATVDILLQRQEEAFSFVIQKIKETNEEINELNLKKYQNNNDAYIPNIDWEKKEVNAEINTQGETKKIKYFIFDLTWGNEKDGVSDETIKKHYPYYSFFKKIIEKIKNG